MSAFEELRSKALYADSVSFAKLCHIIDQQFLYIFGAFPQRRQIDIEGANTEKKVFAKLSFFNHFIQVFVRGGYESEIALNFPVRSKRAKTMLLENSQKVLLERGRKFTYLIEKKCAAIGLFYKAITCFFCTGKGAFLMSKEDALHKGLRQ